MDAERAAEDARLDRGEPRHRPHLRRGRRIHRRQTAPAPAARSRRSRRGLRRISRLGPCRSCGFAPATGRMPPVPGELHPFLSHFAVALLVIGPACDALGVALRRNSLLQAGRWNTLVGAVCAAVALASGLAARAALGPHGPAGEALLNLHGGLAWVLLAAWAPVAVWRALS